MLNPDVQAGAMLGAATGCPEGYKPGRDGGTGRLITGVTGALHLLARIGSQLQISAALKQEALGPS